MAEKIEKNAATKVSAKPAVKKDKKPSVFKRISKWFKDLITEIKKITWPTIPQALKNTLVVGVMVLVVGAYIWILDALLGGGIDLLRGLFS